MSFVRTKDQEARIPLALYFGDSYFTEQQLYSQSKQIHEVHAFRPKSVLEIGKGNGFVSDFLKKSGMRVVTVDVNPELAADYTMDIRNLRSVFKENEFDCILCAEVLEHLPLSELHKLSRDILDISSLGAVITLPRADRTGASFRMTCNLPKIGTKSIGFEIPISKKRRSIYDGHHWEINHSAESSLQQIRKLFLSHFSECRDFRFALNPYHHYFSLTK